MKHAYFNLISTCAALGIAMPTLACLQPPEMQEPESAPAEMQPPMEEMQEMDAPSMQPTGLSGPSVPQSAERTLVHYTARGELLRLETLPEIAALDLLQLDPQRRQESWAIIEEYRESVKILLVDQIDLLKESSDAQRDGDNARVQEIYRQMYGIFNPDRARDHLAAPLTPILTPDERAEFTQLIDDYWNAWITWELRNRQDPTDVQRAQVQERLAFGAFQRLIAQAYQQSLQPYQRKFESLYAMTEPSEDQRAELRELLVEFIRETRLSPTVEQRATLARDIYDALEPEQRVKLTEYALSRM